jgi:hypothetical protein
MSMTEPTRARKTPVAKKGAFVLERARQVPPNGKSVPPASPPAVAGLAKPKQKLVRDSFTIPKPEYAVLQALKERAIALRRPTKKSELLRAGIATLAALSDKAFLAAIGKVPSLTPGRPRQDAADHA